MKHLTPLQLCCNSSKLSVDSHGTSLDPMVRNKYEAFDTVATLFLHRVHEALGRISFWICLPEADVCNDMQSKCWASLGF